MSNKFSNRQQFINDVLTSLKNIIKNNNEETYKFVDKDGDINNLLAALYNYPDQEPQDPLAKFACNLYVALSNDRDKSNISCDLLQEGSQKHLQDFYNILEKLFTRKNITNKIIEQTLNKLKDEIGLIFLPLEAEEE